MRKRKTQPVVAAHPSGLTFLQTLFEPLPDGLIEIRALSPSGGVAGQDWFNDPADAYEFATSFERKANVYFGAAKRSRREGNKASVLAATAIWFDLDCVNLGWDTEKCLERIALLEDMMPSATVRSGGGVHGYYFLSEPEADHAKVEEANALARDAFSADRVQNVDRILRVPDTWNAKRGKPCKVQWCQGFRRFDLRPLTASLRKLGSIFSDADFPRAAISERTIGLGPRRPGSKMPLGEIWQRVQYHGGQGAIGIDDAVTTTTARLHCLGWPDHLVVEETLRRVKTVHREQAPAEFWDWDAEVTNIQRKLGRWKERWPALKAKKSA